MLRDQTMLSPSCTASRFATRHPCPRGKGKFFGSILVTLMMLGSTIARSAEPPGEYQGFLGLSEQGLPARLVPARPAGTAGAVHREVWPASVDNHSRAVDGRPCRHRFA